MYMWEPAEAFLVKNQTGNGANLNGMVRDEKHRTSASCGAS